MKQHSLLLLLSLFFFFSEHGHAVIEEKKNDISKEEGSENRTDQITSKNQNEALIKEASTLPARLPPSIKLDQNNNQVEFVSSSNESQENQMWITPSGSNNNNNFSLKSPEGILKKNGCHPNRDGSPSKSVSFDETTFHDEFAERLKKNITDAENDFQVVQYSYDPAGLKMLFYHWRKIWENYKETLKHPFFAVKNTQLLLKQNAFVSAYEKLQQAFEKQFQMIMPNNGYLLPAKHEEEKKETLKQPIMPFPTFSAPRHNLSEEESKREYIPTDSLAQQASGESFPPSIRRNSLSSVEENFNSVVEEQKMPEVEENQIDPALTTLKQRKQLLVQKVEQKISQCPLTKDSPKEKAFLAGIEESLKAAEREMKKSSPNLLAIDFFLQSVEESEKGLEFLDQEGESFSIDAYSWKRRALFQAGEYALYGINKLDFSLFKEATTFFQKAINIYEETPARALLYYNKGIANVLLEEEELLQLEPNKDVLTLVKRLQKIADDGIKNWEEDFDDQHELEARHYNTAFLVQKKAIDQLLEDPTTNRSTIEREIKIANFIVTAALVPTIDEVTTGVQKAGVAYFEARRDRSDGESRKGIVYYEQSGDCFGNAEKATSKSQKENFQHAGDYFFKVAQETEKEEPDPEVIRNDLMAAYKYRNRAESSSCIIM